VVVVVVAEVVFSFLSCLWQVLVVATTTIPWALKR